MNIGGRVDGWITANLADQVFGMRPMDHFGGAESVDLGSRSSTDIIFHYSILTSISIPMVRTPSHFPFTWRYCQKSRLSRALLCSESQNRNVCSQKPVKRANHCAKLRFSF